MRYRAKLVAIRAGLKAQIHAVLARSRRVDAVSDLFGVTGRRRLARVPLGPAHAQRIRSAAGTPPLRDLGQFDVFGLTGLPEPGEGLVRCR